MGRRDEQVRRDLDDVTARLAFVRTHMAQVVVRLSAASGADDWYPSGSSGGGGGTSELTPTERAAERRMARRGQPDPAAADVRRLEAQLAKAGHAVWLLEQQVRRYVTTSDVAAPVRRCTRCAAPIGGPVRRGLCGGCYKAWERAGKPVVFSA